MPPERSDTNFSADESTAGFDTSWMMTLESWILGIGPERPPITPRQQAKVRAAAQATKNTHLEKVGFVDLHS